MYGQQSTQLSALALTGASALYYSVAAGVLLFAGLTLITIALTLKHKAKKRKEEEDGTDS
jgi:uncharacterized membrane protein